MNCLLYFTAGFSLKKSHEHKRLYLNVVVFFRISSYFLVIDWFFYLDLCQIIAQQNVPVYQYR